MDAIQLLDDQHRDVEALFKKLTEEQPRSQQKRELFQELADDLAIHATIEENHFYPAVKARRTEDILLESLQEHLTIKRLLADLMTITVDDELFDTKLEVLREQFDHHVAEERGDLFPKVRKLLDADQLEAIGQLMTATVVELQGRAPRLDVLGQTVAAPPLGAPRSAESRLRRGLLGRLIAPPLQALRMARAIAGGIADGIRGARQQRGRHA